MEEKKKGSDLKIFFLVFVLVIIVAVVAYVYLYMPLAEQRNTLLRENYDLEYQLIELKNMAVEEENFKKGINESQAAMQKVLNHYSAGNTPEKSIMMTNTLEKEVGVKFPNLSFSQPNLITTVKMPIITDTEDGGYSIGYYDVSLLSETLSSNYECSYDQLKKLIDFIHVYPERMNINSISINYNGETRKLQGNVTLNLFAVTGTGKEYVAPDISGLSLGETNIFEQ